MARSRHSFGIAVYFSLSIEHFDIFHHMLVAPMLCNQKRDGNLIFCKMGQLINPLTRNLFVCMTGQLKSVTVHSRQGQ